MNDTLNPISRKILFVDDEYLLLEGIKRQLRREFDLHFATSGQAGLQTLAEHGPFAVVVSDYNMPEMDGIEFLNAVYRVQPQTVLVMLTGRAELDVAVNALHNAHISRFLNKPCQKQLLQETLNDGLEQYRLRMSEQLLKAQLQQANQELNFLNTGLEALVEQKARALTLQYRHVANMAQMAHSDAVIDELITAVKELIGLEGIQLWLSPRTDGRFVRFYPNQAAASLSEQELNELLGTAPSREPIRLSAAASSCIGDLIIPLQSKQGLIGFLGLAGDLPIFSDDSLAALSGLADVSATALQSHWHREAFTEAQDAIITALAKLSEYRDPETGAHLLRLKKYCALLCHHLAQHDVFRQQVSKAFTDDLVRSSPLHDIGKVGIADAILKKNGRLTIEEFEIMKNHPRIGGDTLRTVYEQYPSQSFIKCGMEVAYCHHEKWDGSGYPQGLAGETIPLSARILALADVYDALTSRRIYKPPFSREKVKAIIEEGCGTHFDPNIVEVFLQIEESFYDISKRYADIE